MGPHAGRRSAPVPVPVGQVGIGILVNPNGNIFLFDEVGNGLSTISFRVHDVAPMAPHSLEIEENEAALRLRPFKQVSRPVLPLDTAMLLSLIEI